MTALFVINRQSARVKKKGSRLLTLAKNSQVKILETDSPLNFKPSFADAIKSGVSHIFIEGGDGTVQTVLTEYFRRLPEGIIPAKFTIVSGGTTNQIAGNIGAKKQTEDHLKKLIKGDGTIHTVPLLDIRVDKSDPHFGLLFSSGAVPMATQYYTDNIRGSGLTGPAAVFATLSAALGRQKEQDKKMLEPSPVKLIVSSARDETRLDEDHLGTLITTLPGFYFGIDPFWAKGQAPIRMTYVRGDQTKLLRLIMSVALKRFEKLDSMEGIESWRADYINLKYKGPLVLDGEPLPTAQNTIEIRASQPVTFVA